MTYPPAVLTRQNPSAPKVLAVLLHPSGSADAALRLARAWGPSVPTANISTLPVSHGSEGVDEAMAQLVQKLSRAGLGAAHLVLAGVCGAGEIALQLAFGPNALGCAGILACGDMVLPLAPLARNSAASGTRLRLVWEADDPLLCAAALGGLLRCFRTAGLDAQGSVLGPETRASSDVHGGVAAGCNPSAALVRLGRAYLAELVAVALGSTLAASGAGAAAIGSDPGEHPEGWGVHAAAA